MPKYLVRASLSREGLMGTLKEGGSKRRPDASDSRAIGFSGAARPSVPSNLVNAASDLYSAVAGRIVEVNEKLASRPELVNSDPYGECWILKLELSGDLPADLLDKPEHKKVTEASAH